MYIVAIAWVFVVVLMAAAEATSTQGTVLGAFFTLLLYGALPLSIVLYVMGAPARRRALRQQEARQMQEMAQPQAGSAPPDGGGVAAGDPVAAEGKKP